MKRILMFIALKVVETTALVFGPYYLGWLFRGYFFELEPRFEPSLFDFWMSGIVCLLIPFFALLVLFGIAAAVYWNWQWAGHLGRKK